MRLCYYVLYLLAAVAFYVSGTSADCSLEGAELRVAEYGTKFDFEAASFRRTSNVSDSFMKLCIDKLNGSETSIKFWNSTNSCLPEEVDYVIQQWNETEKDVNGICMEACPGYANFPGSAYIVDMTALTKKRYTDFCRSMNTSMAYAKGNATSCKFEMSIYYSFLPDGARKYWDDVCQLGCSNLDNSISSISICHHGLTGQTPTCEEHWDFKQCINKRGGVCINVIVKYYTDFYHNEKLCITTTSTTSTTIPRTTTTAIMTTTITTAIIKDTTTLPLSSTETARDKETSQVPVSALSPFASSTSSSGSESTSPARMLNISACITEGDNQFFAQKFPNLTKEMIMKVLKIESCLYGLNNDPNIVKKAVVGLPQYIQEMFIRVHKEGYDVLINLPECVKPKPKDVNCDGHNYGILACSGDAPCCTKILLFISTLILADHFFQ